MSEDMSYHDEEEKEDDLMKKNIKPNDLNNTQTSKVSKSSKSSKTSSSKSKENNDENSSKSSSKNSGSKKMKLKSTNKNSQIKEKDESENVVSTRTYLEENVVSVVQEGMYELAKKRPENPLEFLGNYILERAKNK